MSSLNPEATHSQDGEGKWLIWGQGSTLWQSVLWRMGQPSLGNRGGSAKHGSAEEFGWSTLGMRRMKSGAQDRGPSLSLFFEEMRSGD